MNSSLLRAATIVMLSTLAGCESTEPFVTGEFATFGTMIIQGRATNAAGSPLDSVITNAKFPANRAGEFTTGQGFSAADGRYQLIIKRIQPTTNVPDTVTFTFVAFARATRHIRPDGTMPTDSTRLTVQLRAEGSLAPIITIDAKLPAP